MIITIGVNPVLDIIYESNDYSVEEREFFSNTIISGGGFALNATRALACIVEPSCCYIISGGETGKILRAVLTNENFDFINSSSKANTRNASIKVSGSTSSMWVSPSPSIARYSLNRLFDKVYSSTSASDIVLVGGSVPSDLEVSYFEQIRKIGKKTKYCCYDIRTANWNKLTRFRPFIMRLPYKLREGKKETSLIRILESAVDSGVQLAILNTTPTSLLAVTDNAIYKVKSPNLKAVNPFGAGDCLMAILSAWLSKDNSTQVSLCFAMAAASASVLTAIPGSFDLRKAEDLLPEVSIKRLERR